jgi:hypothetical protein
LKGTIPQSGGIDMATRLSFRTVAKPGNYLEAAFEELGQIGNGKSA